MPELPTSDEVLARRAAAYAGLGSYRDRGEVVTRFTGAGGHRHAQRILFTTHFIRPDRFRFEFRDLRFAGAPGGPDSSYILWRCGGDTGSHWSLRGAREFGPLPRLVAAATGVSGGSAYTIPSLLLPELAWKEGPDRPASPTPEVVLDGAESPARIGLRVRREIGVRTTWHDGAWLIRSVHEVNDFTVEYLERQERQVRRALGREYRPPHSPPRAFSSESVTTYHAEPDAEIHASVFSDPLNAPWPAGFV